MFVGTNKVLMEFMNSKFDQVFERLASLENKIDKNSSELHEKVEVCQQDSLKSVISSFDAIQAKLDSQHQAIRQNTHLCLSIHSNSWINNVKSQVRKANDMIEDGVVNTIKNWL